ncbi:MAG TPA: hypothetical protein VJJ81_03600 [Candidatus Babeliales bacterium]|nr:hypothetical protein [Candidatus Babeliales bacterium]
MLIKHIGLLLLLGSFGFDIFSQPVNLVWQVSQQGLWELDWLPELFSGLEIQNINDGKFEKFINNSIVVVQPHSFSDTTNTLSAKSYFKKLRDAGYKFGILLLSDEAFIAPTDSYRYANFVFRTSWDSKYNAFKNVLVFPLGYKTGFWKDCDKNLKPAIQRKYTWSFAGQSTGKQSRADMFKNMKQISNYFIHETYTWDDPNALKTNVYRDVLLDTIIVPCPSGWINPDTFRTYEALECGCIPIVEKGYNNYYESLLGKHPMPVVESWEQAPDLVKSLLADPVGLEQLRVKCQEWWLDCKRSFNYKMTKTIKHTFRIK